MTSRTSAPTTSRWQRIGFRSGFLLLAACAKRPPQPDELSALPRVPSPESGTYARVSDVPPDPVIARVISAYHYDASLGGAAAGLALQAARGTGGYTPWEVRESAWRAGWPYPVSQLRAWQTEAGAPPPDALTAWLAGLPEGQSVGLVRVRAETADSWVGLSAAPALDLGTIRRLMQLGETIRLPAVAGAVLVVGDPVGAVHDYPLDAPVPVPLDRAGEWIFDVRLANATVARFPVYVDMIPPKLDLFAVDGLPDDPAARAEALVGMVREAYGGAPWRRDRTLDSVATSALDDPIDVAGAAGRLGFDRAATAAWSCDAPTVEGCLDAVIWRPEARRAFLLDNELLGLAVRATAERVRIEAVVAPE